MITPHTTAPLTLTDALARAGLDLTKDRVILFGSRALGAATSESDWDLCVVRSPRTVTFRSVHDGVDLVPVREEDWRSPAFMCTELAASLAFNAVPLSCELPSQALVRFDAIRDAVEDRARRKWATAIRIDPERRNRIVDYTRRKAATSALLAIEYYGLDMPCPARATLVKRWANMDMIERAVVLGRAGLNVDPPHAPPSDITPMMR